MGFKKVYPKKVAITILCIFIIGTIWMSLVLLTVSFQQFIYCLLIGGLISPLMAGINYLEQGITVKDFELIIKYTKKFRVNIKDIYKLEYGSKKAILGSEIPFFLIYFKNGKDEMVYKIKDNVYFTKELKELFEELGLKHEIPLNIRKIV